MLTWWRAYMRRINCVQATHAPWFLFLETLGHRCLPVRQLSFSGMEGSTQGVLVYWCIPGPKGTVGCQN